MAAKQSTGNVDAKGAGVHSLRHDEPDGCGVGVPHELWPPILQGEGGCRRVFATECDSKRTTTRCYKAAATFLGTSSGINFLILAHAPEAATPMS